MPLSPRKQPRPSPSEPVQGQSQQDDQDNISMSLVAKNYCSKVMKGLYDLRKSGVLCDYGLVADGLRIPVHKAVMAACSDYFQVMLTGMVKKSMKICVVHSNHYRNFFFAHMFFWVCFSFLVQ